MIALATIAGLAFAVAAVAQDVPDAGPQGAAAFETLDATLLRVTDDVPEFGGVFIDTDGALALYLTNPAQKDRAVVALERRLDASVTRSRRVRVLQAQFSFSELSLFRAMVQPAFAMKGVTMADVDEAANRVTVGVETTADARVVSLDLLRYGVPAEALRVIVTGPIRPVVTVRDRIRPMVGGLQINFGSYLCTAGFMATRAGVRGFVTNSHCTGSYGGVTGTVYYQPLRSTSGSRVGVETVDPSFRTSSTCPAGRVCRWSDSAFVRFDSAVTSNRGKIARTNGIGSLTINGTTPRFRISSELGGAPLVGETLNKVGRTTGWTRGTVRYTCVLTTVSGTNRAFYCQDMVAARVSGGDSGSPVFKVTTSPDRVKLYGVLWGGNSAGTLFAFSRFANIQRELGTLTTCDSSLAGC